MGSDSHTPTAGGVGMLAMGCGGLDIASAMSGFPYSLVRPRVRQVRLTGQLKRPWVTAMDVGLEMLRRLTVRGGVGWVMEYAGPGLAHLSVPERATITNLGAELGAVEAGYGGCIIGSVNKSRVAKILNLPENLEILWVLALGKPIEQVVIDDVVDGEIKYWRDKNQVHHVPKRSLEELIHKIV